MRDQRENKVGRHCWLRSAEAQRCGRSYEFIRLSLMSSRITLLVSLGVLLTGCGSGAAQGDACLIGVWLGAREACAGSLLCQGSGAPAECQQADCELFTTESARADHTCAVNLIVNSPSKRSFSKLVKDAESEWSVMGNTASFCGRTAQYQCSTTTLRFGSAQAGGTFERAPADLGKAITASPPGPVASVKY